MLIYQQKYITAQNITPITFIDKANELIEKINKSSQYVQTVYVSYKDNHRKKLFSKKNSNFILDICGKCLIIVTSNDVSNMEEYL